MAFGKIIAEKITNRKKLLIAIFALLILIASYAPSAEGKIDQRNIIEIDQVGFALKNVSAAAEPGKLKGAAEVPTTGIFIKGVMPRKTLTKDLKYYGSYVSTCIVDTGIDFEHTVFLGNSGVEERIPGSRTRILKMRDFIENKDYTIDNFVTGTLASSVSAGFDGISPPPAPTPYIGVAPAANLIVAKVFDNGTLVPGDTLFDYQYDLKIDWNKTRQGFQWCLDNAKDYRVGVISFAHWTPQLYSENSCSIEGANIDDLISKANSMKIPVVVPTGNNGSTSQLPYPACNPSTISVGSSFITGKENLHNCNDNEVGIDKIACFTNRAKNLDLLAPGSDIHTGVPQTFRYGQYAVLSGTPLASSIVVGNILLIKQYLKENNKDATSAQIEEALKTTGTPIYDPKTGLTFPRIDVYRAIYSYFHTINAEQPELDAYVEKGRDWWESKFEVSGNNGVSITINWVTKANLEMEVTDPDGLKYTKETVDADFKYEGPHPIKMTFFKPKKGIWTAKISGKDIEGVKDFKIKAEKVKKSGLPKPPAGINFTSFDITYLNTCQNTGDLKVVFRGVPSQQPSAAQIKEFEKKKAEGGI